MDQAVDLIINDELQEEFYDYVYDDEYPTNDVNYQMFSHSAGISFSEISEACMMPTLYDVCSTYFPVLALCFFFQLLNRFIPINISAKHAVSGVLGVIVLYQYFQSLISHFLILSLVSYFIVNCISSSGYLTSIVSVTLLSYLSICEFTFEGSSWPRIRNLQMLIVMKIISLVSDVESRRISKLPSFLQYFGYIFCVGNCIFGPWVSYSTYLDIFRAKPLDLQYVLRILRCILSSLVFFTLSMCYLDWLLQDTSYINLVLMYGKAMEFRTSHYFIMFMSESFALAAGFGSTDTAGPNCITKPSRIEFPRSLVEVVVYWNVPMHQWLKKYVFKPLSGYGRFIAVVGTYFVSSLLHGLNYQLSGILLSLSVYTFVEHVLRQKLARRLNACILSKSCPSRCSKHRYTERWLSVRFANLIFTVVALYHLSYLGYLIDLRTDQKLSLEQSFYRWRMQWYSSHVVALVTLVLCWLL